MIPKIQISAMLLFIPKDGGGIATITISTIKNDIEVFARNLPKESIETAANAFGQLTPNLERKNPFVASPLIEKLGAIKETAAPEKSNANSLKNETVCAPNNFNNNPRRNAAIENEINGIKTIAKILQAEMLFNVFITKKRSILTNTLQKSNSPTKLIKKTSIFLLFIFGKNIIVNIVPKLWMSILFHPIPPLSTPKINGRKMGRARKINILAKSIKIH